MITPDGSLWTRHQSTEIIINPITPEWYLFFLDAIEIYQDFVFFIRYGSRSMSGGLRKVWGDQRAGGPENLLALRAEGTRASSWPSNGGDNKTEFVMENLVCQIDSVTKYPLLSFVAYVKIYALFGGDQTDQKSACGGPNSIVRTGYEALTPNVLPMT